MPVLLRMELIPTIMEIISMVPKSSTIANIKLLNIAIIDEDTEFVAIRDKSNIPAIHIKVVSLFATINPNISKVNTRYTQCKAFNSTINKITPCKNSIYYLNMQGMNFG